MRSNLAGVLLLPLAASLFASGAVADEDKGADEQAVRKEIESKKEKQIEAYRNKDVAGILANLAPDYKLERWTGQVIDRSHLEANLRQRLNRLKAIGNLVITIDKLTLREKEAVVYSTHDFTRTVVDPQGKEHQVHSIVMHREVWTMTPEGWKAKSVEELYPKLTDNGQPIHLKPRSAKR